MYECVYVYSVTPPNSKKTTSFSWLCRTSAQSREISNITHAKEDWHTGHATFSRMMIEIGLKNYTTRSGKIGKCLSSKNWHIAIVKFIRISN